MPSKTEEYLALAQRTANGLTRYWESWTDYLTTASRLYKYPFADQLMIYAQRPDATACADFDIWNNRMNRYVRRGAKGIALLDESSGFPRLHYVFDVSDTGVRRNSRDPEVWQYNDDLKQPVSEMLAATYGISGERISQQLADVAGKLVADYWDNNGGDVRAIVDGSLLIEKAIIENNARLVIIDPIQAYLGADVDMNRANEVRPIFMRLGQVAQRTGCAILLIGHLNKAAGMQSLQRGLGSIDIAAAVRSVMFIGKLKHDPTMRILTHEKSSLAPPGASLAFSLGDEGGFRWVGEYDITADEMLSGIEPQRETKTQQAKDLICALLTGGRQVFSEDIDKAALERGIPGRTVRDAKRELGDALKSKIVEGRKKVFWME